MKKNKIIETLESLKDDLDTAIWCISDKSYYKEENLTVREAIHCYEGIGKNIDETLDIILKDFGDEKISDFINKD